MMRISKDLRFYSLRASHIYTTSTQYDTTGIARPETERVFNLSEAPLKLVEPEP